MGAIVMEVLEQELTETIKVWPTISKVISTLHSTNQYKKAVTLLDKLVDQVSEREDPVLESLIDLLGTLIKDYEDRTLTEPTGEPIGCLAYLMNEHHLTQDDLKEIGSRGVVADILSGKRQLNIRQIRALSKRFNVSPAVFI